MRRRDCVARRHGDALRRHTARPGLDVHDHQRARGDPLLFLRRGGGEARRLDCETARHGPERHSQGIHGPACLGLSARARAPGHRRHVRVGREAHPALEYDLDLGLSHPRSRCDRRAGARVHAGQWLYVRRAGRRSRARHRQLRGPASFFWDIHNDFFEEIAKLRAARRIWARHVRERYQAKQARSWMMRFHSQTAGVTLTAQQPLNNIVRVAYQALAAVLGGTQSLHTNSLDETLALPTEQSVQVALRTQQILAHETGVAKVIDPLGGSYYVEALTDQLEREAEALFAEITSIGGVVRGIETGWFQRQIAQSAAAFQRQVEMGEKVIVGVNEFLSDDDHPVEILKVSNDAEDEQRRRLVRLRAERDNALVERRLEALRQAA